MTLWHGAPNVLIRPCMDQPDMKQNWSSMKSEPSLLRCVTRGAIKTVSAFTFCFQLSLRVTTTRCRQYSLQPLFSPWIAAWDSQPILRKHHILSIRKIMSVSRPKVCVLVVYESGLEFRCLSNEVALCDAVGSSVSRGMWCMGPALNLVAQWCSETDELLETLVHPATP